MVILILLPLLVAGLAFIIGEWLRRRIKGTNEASRKLVHLLHGLTVIAWLIWVPHQFVVVFEALFFLAMFGVRYAAMHVPQFAWMHKVGRLSWGEFFYPLGIIVAIWLAAADWIVIVAVAQLAISDAVAALAGKHWGKGNTYHVVANTKSIAGTAAFIIVGAAVSALGLWFADKTSTGLVVWSVLVVPILLAVVENLGWRGIDNFTLPVACVLLLNIFA